MNEYSIVVDFQKGNIYTDLSVLVQNDYNAYKLNFEFDKEFERALFKLKYPVENKEWVQDIVDNKLILPVLKDTGDYEYEISIYSEDGRLTGYATEKFHVRSELINTDEIVEPDDRVPVLDNLINETTQLKNETVALKEEVEEAIEETNNLDINISKDGKIATVELTKKDSTTKTITLKDGTSLMFNWDGTRLGIKTDEDEEYVYVDLIGRTGPMGPQGEAFQVKKTYANINLMIADYDNMQINDYVMIDGNIEQEDNAKLFVKQEIEDPTYRWHYLADFSGATGIQGPVGVTPNIQIGTVASGTTPSVTRTGTNENPILNFVLEKGEIGRTGPQGETGNGIVSITKTGTQDTVDTYTILYTNGTTSTFTVTNGEVSQAQLDTVQMELDKYKTLSKLLPKVEGEGNPVTLNNTVDGVTMDITPEGATSQHTTTGKNKFPLASGTINFSGTNRYRTLTSENGIIHDVAYTTEGVEGVYAESVRLSISLLRGGYGNNANFKSDLFTLSAGTYSLNYIHLSGSHSTAGVASNNSNIQLYQVKDNVTSMINSLSNYDDINKSFSFTLTEDTQCYVASSIYVGSGALSQAPLNIDAYYQVTITPGETADYDYEEYTNGQPSPSPDCPQPIKVVTGEQNINVSSRNVFDGELELGNINQWGNVSSNSIIRSKNYIKIKSSNTYNFSSSKTIILNNIQIFFYDENRIFITSNWLYTNRSYFTTPENAKYLRFKINDDTDVSQLIQIEEGTAATTYTPYYSKDYPLSLGTLELAEIGDYKDYIYGSPNNWYKYKCVGKYVLDGETNVLVGKSTTHSAETKGFYQIRISDKHIGSNESGSTNFGISNRFPFVSSSAANAFANNSYGLWWEGNTRYIYMILEQIKLADANNWLTTHNTTIYYLLDTPTSEQITDTILIEQLNNLYNAISAQGTTYITCSSASDDNETLQVKASTYKDISSILNPVVESEGE